MAPLPPACNFKLRRKVTGSMVNLAFVTIFTLIFDLFNDKLLEWENHATDSAYEDGADDDAAARIDRSCCCSWHRSLSARTDVSLLQR